MLMVATSVDSEGLPSSDIHGLGVVGRPVTARADNLRSDEACKLQALQVRATWDGSADSV